MLEAQSSSSPRITGGESSSGLPRVHRARPGRITLGDAAGYRLYLESVFDELAVGVKVLFDRHDAASLLWPRRKAFEAMLEEINNPELAPGGNDDETIAGSTSSSTARKTRQRMRR
jgi:hypothetical protein